jgi:hypothetical protein
VSVRLRGQSDCPSTVGVCAAGVAGGGAPHVLQLRRRLAPHWLLRRRLRCGRGRWLLLRLLLLRATGRPAGRRLGPRRRSCNGSRTTVAWRRRGLANGSSAPPAAVSSRRSTTAAEPFRTATSRGDAAGFTLYMVTIIEIYSVKPARSRRGRSWRQLQRRRPPAPAPPRSPAGFRCTARAENPPKRAVKRPARPYDSPIQNGFSK